MVVLSVLFLLASVCSAILQIDNLNLHTFQKAPKLLLDNTTEVTFNHGIASGDPSVDAVILWTRITPVSATAGSIAVYVKISASPFFENAKTFVTHTNSAADYTVKVDVLDLQPNTTYYYQFASAGGQTTRVGRTKTLPSPDFEGPLNLAVYSCSNYAGGFFTAYAMPTVKDSVDYVIHLGDYIYEYKNGKYTDGTSLNRTHWPDREMWTLEDYRERYASYHEDPDLQLSHAMHPWILVWDDHEIADNCWLRGSVNSEGWKFLARKQAGVQAYFEWLPIRPQEDIYKIWRGKKFGKLLDLLMLDTRHYSRDITDIYTNTQYIAAIAYHPERTMMGFDQEEWLYNSLQKSEAIWKVIGSQTVINHVDFTPIGKTIGAPFEEADYDSFDGYTANRDRLLDAVSNVSDVVVVSGDFHIAWAHEISQDPAKYNMKTGEGANLVEFATSAVSSPTTFPKNYTVEQCLELSKKLLAGNTGVIWNEGWFRGYFEMQLTTEEVDVLYYGVNVSTSAREEVLLAEFAVDRGTSRIRRDFEGQQPYGYLDKRVIG